MLQPVQARGKWMIWVHFYLTYYTDTICQYVSYVDLHLLMRNLSMPSLISVRSALVLGGVT
jgi:hypothetical protein